jgi:SAM-dependent methyltransferase
MRFYDDRAGRFEEMGYSTVLLGDQDKSFAAAWHAFETDSILPKLELRPPGRVLDVGCGVGRWGDIFLPLGFDYTGVDFSAEMVKTAAKRGEAYAQRSAFYNLSLLQAVEKDAEYYGGVFDALIMAGVCMYINDDELKQSFDMLPALLNEVCVIYIENTVAKETRLTLDRFPSEALKTDYDAIYRTEAEYREMFGSLAGAGFAVKEQGFLLKSNGAASYSETDRWYAVLKRGA